MTRPLFTQSIETALASKVGEAGADDAAYKLWRERLGALLPKLTTKPAPELASIIHQVERTDDLAQIESIATRFAELATDLVVVGMGGSSLSAETLCHLRKQGGLNLHYVDNIDPITIDVLIATLPWKTTHFLIVSKSGGTVEVQALLAIFLREAKARGANIAKQFVVITIPNQNPLHQLASDYGMELVSHDEDLCGRYSIFSAVGLIPAAAVGVDIRALRSGAGLVLSQNMAGDAPALDAAALHLAFFDKSSPIQVLMHYSDRLRGIAKWCRQSWAESLGKHERASTPIRSRGATDQHSQLQLYLAGPKDKFFTALMLDVTGQGAAIDYPDTKDARLRYLSGQRLGDLIMAEQRGTNDTLVAAGRPLRSITFERLDEYVMGGLLMHFTLEVAFTAALLGINPFDQPAVEASKKRTLEYLNAHDR